jgi:Leucine-rich repeat (LRR) protein
MKNATLIFAFLFAMTLNAQKMKEGIDELLYFIPQEDARRLGSEKTFRTIDEALVDPAKARILILTHVATVNSLTSLSKLVNLEILVLNKMSLSSLPSEIFQLKQLKVLMARDNRIESIPQQVANLQELRILDLSFNRIRTIPKQMGTMSKLIYLTLQENQISVLPDEVITKNLAFVFLAENSFDKQTASALKEKFKQRSPYVKVDIIGYDPEEARCAKNVSDALRNPEKYQALYINGSTYDNDPDYQLLGGRMGELTEISQLHMANVKVIPASVGKMKNLMFLTINNADTVAIPESIGELSRLRLLEINYGKIGMLPESIGGLKALEFLSMTGTPITQLPVGIGMLENLETLSLRDTGLTSLPSEIANLKKLKNLYLSGSPIQAAAKVRINKMLQQVKIVY